MSILKISFRTIIILFHNYRLFNVHQYSRDYISECYLFINIYHYYQHVSAQISRNDIARLLFRNYYLFIIYYYRRVSNDAKVKCIS